MYACLPVVYPGEMWGSRVGSSGVYPVNVENVPRQDAWVQEETLIPGLTQSALRHSDLVCIDINYTAGPAVEREPDTNYLHISFACSGTIRTRAL